MYAGVPTPAPDPGYCDLEGDSAHDDTVARPGTRLYGQGEGVRFWGDTVNDVFPKTSMPAPRQMTRTAGTLRLPRAPAVMADAGAVNRADVALYSSRAAHSQSVSASPHKNRKGEATGQAPLAAWEDEGGATAIVK
jgi:hypothetical protein